MSDSDEYEDQYDGERFVTDSQAAEAMDQMNERFAEEGREKMAEITSMMGRLLTVRSEEWSNRKVFGAHVTFYDDNRDRHYDSEADEWERENPDEPDIIPRRGLVIAGDVSGEAERQRMWDPYQGEYRKPSDYPFGTINVVVAEGTRGGDPREFGNQYCSGVDVRTSVVPTDDPTDPDPHTYAPGWPDDMDAARAEFES